LEVLLEELQPPLFTDKPLLEALLFQANILEEMSLEDLMLEEPLLDQLMPPPLDLSLHNKMLTEAQATPMVLLLLEEQL